MKSGFFIFAWSHMHPSIRILTLLIFSIAVYGIRFQQLALLLVMMITLMFVLDWRLKRFHEGKSSMQEYLNLLRRIRYILIFLIVIYAFNTPGEYLFDESLVVAPTYEGISAGFEQMLRLAAILAGLALLLSLTSREQLIAGLYWLARPLSAIGIDVERFAIRLWLTLYYVEHGLKNNKKSLIGQLKSMDAMSIDDAHAPERIIIMKPALHPWDIGTLLVLALICVVLLCA